MTLVVDASLLVAWLLNDDPTGAWATRLLSDDDLAAPQLVLAETANVIRKSAAVSAIGEDGARAAHRDLVDLPIELFDYRPFAERIWELRSNVATYDAWYVAVAEALDAPLGTLDTRLVNAPGPRCRMVTMTTEP